MNKRLLGRGLASLLGPEEGGSEAGAIGNSELIQIPVESVDPNPFQPRRTFDPAEIASLADSIRQHGMIQPILVRTVGDRYQLIAGERRLRASAEARLHEVPARVMELSDQRVAELAMVENLQREDLGPLEKATAFRAYLDAYGGTQEELGTRLGVDRSTITNLIRLLDLPEPVRDALSARKITQGHARALLALEGAEAQVDALMTVIADKLSVRETEALVAAGAPPKSRPRLRKDGAHEPAPRPPHVLELEGNLRQRFGTTVQIRVKARERGQIVIDFNSQEEFDRVCGLIGG